MSALLDEQINMENLLRLANDYGNAFYLLDTEAFRENYQELSAEFKKSILNLISLTRIRQIIFLIS